MTTDEPNSVIIPITDDVPKYIVFKTEDWNRVRGEQDWLVPMAVPDAVVIRLQDHFAATALFTYCNTIMGFLELLETHVEGWDENDHQRLLDIADYFHEQACESQKLKNKKLPD